MGHCYILMTVFAVDRHPIDLSALEHAATFSLFVWNRNHKKIINLEKLLKYHKLRLWSYPLIFFLMSSIFTFLGFTVSKWLLALITSSIYVLFAFLGLVLFGLDLVSIIGENVHYFNDLVAAYYFYLICFFILFSSQMMFRS